MTEQGHFLSKKDTVATEYLFGDEIWSTLQLKPHW